MPVKYRENIGNTEKTSENHDSFWKKVVDRLILHNFAQKNYVELVCLQFSFIKYHDFPKFSRYLMYIIKNISNMTSFWNVVWALSASWSARSNYLVAITNTLTEILIEIITEMLLQSNNLYSPPTESWQL